MIRLLHSNKILNNHFDYTFNEVSIINKCLLVINSINRMELNSIEYYTTIQNYQHNLNNYQNGLYIYSFALNPKELQPSGSINFSKIEDSYLQFNMNNFVNYQNNVLIKCYAIQYNLIKISLGTLQFGFP